MADDPGAETTEAAAGAGPDGGDEREARAPDEVTTTEIVPLGSPVAPTEPGADPPATPPRPRRRWPRRLLVAVVLLGVVVAAAVATGWEPVARWYVLREAARRGVRLTPRAMQVEWGRATFTDVQVELDGVPDLRLEVARLVVSAEGLTPRDVLARGVTGRARSADALRQVVAFGVEHRGDLVPARAEGVRLLLGEDGDEVLEARAASAELPAAGPARIEDAVVDVPRPRLVIGPVPLVVSARPGAIEVWLGGDAGAAPLHVVADLEARALVLRLAATRATTVAAWLGRPASSGPPPWPAHLALEAQAELRWPADPRADLTGTARATLLGVVPPHPPELAGIVFGEDTAVAMDLRAGPSSTSIALPRLEVAVGSLRLAGTGTIAPRGASFVATAQLRGAIPCAELAGSAAVAHLGLSLGSGLGTLARHGLAGSVDVRVGITVDGDRPMQPDVRPAASVHCRLRLPL